MHEVQAYVVTLYVGLYLQLMSTAAAEISPRMSGMKIDEWMCGVMMARRPGRVRTYIPGRVIAPKYQ